MTYPNHNIAWSMYDIITKADDVVEVFFGTNDDGDTGFPGKVANQLYQFYGSQALENAKKFTGKSRQGVGHRVYVTLDGEEY